MKELTKADVRPWLMALASNYLARWYQHAVVHREAPFNKYALNLFTRAQSGEWFFEIENGEVTITFPHAYGGRYGDSVTFYDDGEGGAVMSEDTYLFRNNNPTLFCRHLHLPMENK